MSAIRMRRQVLAVKGGSLNATVQIVDGERVVVLVKRHDGPTDHPIGTVFVRNRALARQSDIGWMAYPDLYRAWRAQLMIDRNAGGREGIENGELQALLADRRAVRAYVRSVLTSGTCGLMEEERSRVILKEVARQLATKRNRSKLIAQLDIERAEEVDDARGRRNPPAAAMAAGAGIGRLMDREQELQAILGYVSVRAFRIHRLIDEISFCYERLLGALGGRHSSARGLLMALAEQPTMPNMAQTCRLLQEHLNAFRFVYAQPFLGNVRHLRRDLDDAIATASVLADGGEAIRVRELRLRYERMRQGIRWMNALHYLEVRVMTPLSLLMEDARRDGRGLKQAANAPRHESVEIAQAFAPERFAYVTDGMRRFRKAADLCPDNALRNPVQQSVLTYIDEALSFAKQDDLPEAKKSLRNATDILSGRV